MYFAKDQGVRQAQGNRGAIEILEARSIAKSDGLQLYVRKQLQYSAWSAPRSRQVNRSRAAAGEWSSRSRAAAKAGTLLVASWVRSRSQMKRRRLTCSDEVETRYDIDEVENQHHVVVRFPDEDEWTSIPCITPFSPEFEAESLHHPPQGFRVRTSRSHKDEMERCAPSSTPPMWERADGGQPLVDEDWHAICQASTEA